MNCMHEIEVNERCFGAMLKKCVVCNRRRLYAKKMFRCKVCRGFVHKRCLSGRNEVVSSAVTNVVDGDADVSQTIGVEEILPAMVVIVEEESVNISHVPSEDSGDVTGSKDHGYVHSSAETIATTDLKTETDVEEKIPSSSSFEDGEIDIAKATEGKTPPQIDLSPALEGTPAAPYFNEMPSEVTNVVDGGADVSQTIGVEETSPTMAAIDEEKSVTIATADFKTETDVEEDIPSSGDREKAAANIRVKETTIAAKDKTPPPQIDLSSVLEGTPATSCLNEIPAKVGKTAAADCTSSFLTLVKNAKKKRAKKSAINNKTQPPPVSNHSSVLAFSAIVPAANKKAPTVAPDVVVDKIPSKVVGPSENIVRTDSTPARTEPPSFDDVQSVSSDSHVPAANGAPSVSTIASEKFANSKATAVLSKAPAPSSTAVVTSLAGQIAPAAAPAASGVVDAIPSDDVQSGGLVTDLPSLRTVCRQKFDAKKRTKAVETSVSNSERAPIEKTAVRSEATAAAAAAGPIAVDGAVVLSRTASSEVEEIADPSTAAVTGHGEITGFRVITETDVVDVLPDAPRTSLSASAKWRAKKKAARKNKNGTPSPDDSAGRPEACSSALATGVADEIAPTAFGVDKTPPEAENVARTDEVPSSAAAKKRAAKRRAKKAKRKASVTAARDAALTSVSLTAADICVRNADTDVFKRLRTSTNPWKTELKEPPVFGFPSFVKSHVGLVDRIESEERLTIHYDVVSPGLIDKETVRLTVSPDIVYLGKGDTLEVAQEVAAFSFVSDLHQMLKE